MKRGLELKELSIEEDKLNEDIASLFGEIRADSITTLNPNPYTLNPILYGNKDYIIRDYPRGGPSVH